MREVLRLPSRAKSVYQSDGNKEFKKTGLRKRSDKGRPFRLKLNVAMLTVPMEAEVGPGETTPQRMMLACLP